MIAWLKGELMEKQPPSLLLNVNGVGYELEAPMSTFYDLPGTGEIVTLFVHMVVREDAQLLFAYQLLLLYNIVMCCLERFRLSKLKQMGR